MVARTATNALGRKAKVAVLQPFLKRAGRPLPGSQDQLKATATYGEAASKLEEAVALVDTLGCDVVFKEVVPLRSVHPKFLFGSGKAAELSGAVSAAEADCVFVNAPLSGQQQKGLAAKWDGAKVLDRFRVILDIFADRARTTEAKLQVELAGLRYQSSHLVKGADSGYDRQRGGLGAVGGSGEKAIETQRRLLRDRTAEVKRLLKDVERRRGYQRSARDRRLEPTVALVGYTNVGKSSLLNQLALARHDRRPPSHRQVAAAGEVKGGGEAGEGSEGAGGRREGGGGVSSGTGKGMVHARNRVFDTLDPTVRSVTLPSRARCVLVDTVGFIQDLPTDLVLSFKSTLEEVKSADMLLHVRDASVDHRICEAQRKAVEETLGELGAGAVPTLEVWNKVDKERREVAGPAAPASSPAASTAVFESDGEGGSGAHQGEERCGGQGGGGGGGGPRGDMSLPDEDEGEGEAATGGSVVSGRELDPETASDGDGGGGGGPYDRGEVVAGGLNTLQQRSASAMATTAAPRHTTGPDDADAIRVSATTGQGLTALLEKLDAMLNMGEGVGRRRFAAKPADRYQYVRVLPGQSQRGRGMSSPKR